MNNVNQKQSASKQSSFKGVVVNFDVKLVSECCLAARNYPADQDALGPTIILECVKCGRQSEHFQAGE